MKNSTKPVKYLRLCFLVLQFLPFISSAQYTKDTLKSQSFTVYNLTKFGKIYVPNGLDTFNQGAMKNMLYDEVSERIESNSDKKMKDKINLIRSRYNYLDSNSIYFWPSHTLTRILSPKYIRALVDSTPIDPEDDIQYVPNFIITRTTVKFHSSALVKYYFIEKDSTEKYIQEIKSALIQTIRFIYPESEIIPMSSENYFIENKYPVVGLHFEIKFFDGERINESIISIYSLMKNYTIYNLRYEYLRNSIGYGRTAIKEMIMKSKFN